MRKIITAILAMISFVLLFLGWQTYERNKLNQVYELLEKNIAITQPERISVNKIISVHKAGIDSLVADEFKNEFATIINNRYQTNLTAEDMTIQSYESMIDISFLLPDHITYIYRYYLSGTILKNAAIEKHSKTYMVFCNDENSVRRSLTYNKSITGRELRFVLNCSGSALIYIILILFVFGKKNKRNQPEEEWMAETGKHMKRKQFRYLKPIVGGIIIILPIWTFTYCYNLIYSPQFVSNKAEHILEQVIRVSEEERIPAELIKRAINDYEEEVMKDQYQRIDFHLRSPENSPVISDKLQTLLDHVVLAEQNDFNFNFTTDNINTVSMSLNTISIFYTWNKDSYTLFYNTDGRIEKSARLSGEYINYHIINYSNNFIQLDKSFYVNIETLWSMRFSFWLSSYLCFVAFLLYYRRNNMLIFRAGSMIKYGFILIFAGIVLSMNIAVSLGFICGIAMLVLLEYYVKQSKAKIRQA